MAFKLKNPPFPKKPKRRKKNKPIEPMHDPEIFASEPYSATSISRSVADKKYHSGLFEGYVPELESKLTFNPSTQQYTRTQVESEPAYLKRACKK